MKPKTPKHEKTSFLCIRLIVGMVLVLFSITSCFGQPAPTDLISSELTLFHKNDTPYTSTQSGNLLFGSFLTSDGTYIYYHSKDRSKLLRSDFDGANKKVLSSKTAYFISVVDDTVFFLDNKTNGSIHKVGINGDGEVLVKATSAKSLVSTHRFLFYIHSETGFVDLILHDGSGQKPILERLSTQLLLYHDRLYISVSADKEEDLPAGVYSCAISDIESAIASESDLYDILEFVESDQQLNYLNVFNESLYYFNDKNSTINFWSASKRPKILMQADTVRPFIVSDYKLFFINRADQNRLYRMDYFQNKKSYAVVNDKVNDFVICGNMIYYKRENSAIIFGVPINGGISFKIS